MIGEFIITLHCPEQNMSQFLLYEFFFTEILTTDYLRQVFVVALMKLVTKIFNPMIAPCMDEIS